VVTIDSQNYRWSPPSMLSKLCISVIVRLSYFLNEDTSSINMIAKAQLNIPVAVNYSLLGRVI